MRVSCVQEHRDQRPVALATGLVAQGKAIFDALRGDVMDYDDEHDTAPLVPNSESSQHRG